jgi:predicted acylesterase/phospholipase RssA
LYIRFVCSQAKEIGRITLLRSYCPKGVYTEPATIWEAALATSAATSFFDPVQIGDRLYVDGAMGANNPSEEVEKEASNIWCELTGKLEPLVKCFISVGTGNGGINPISDKAWKLLTESLVKVATDTKRTEEAVSGRWREHQGSRYFRFNVQQGLQNVGLAEYKDLGLTEAATADYLESQETKPRLYDCVMNLRKKKC